LIIIAARVLQGVGAACVWPALMGITCASVDEKHRGSAVGAVIGAASLGNAAGPVVGGALTQWLSWRWVLLINVPLSIFAAAIAAFFVAEQKSELKREADDWSGIAVVSTGLIALMIAVDQSMIWTWLNWKTLSLLIGAILLLTIFPAIERSRTNVLVPYDLMRNPSFMCACLVIACACQVFFIINLYVPEYSEKFRADDPLQAGLHVAAFMLGFAMVSFTSGKLCEWIGAKPMVTGGLLIISVTMVLLALLGPDIAWYVQSPLLMVVGIGLGAIIAAVTTAAVAAAGVARASLASGISFRAQLAGAALIFAIATTLFATVGTSSLQHRLGTIWIKSTQLQQVALTSLLVGAETAQAVSRPGPADPPISEIQIASESYLAALRATFLFSAAVTLVASFVAMLSVGGPLRRRGTDKGVGRLRVQD
jgi:MFS family permease